MCFSRATDNFHLSFIVSHRSWEIQVLKNICWLPNSLTNQISQVTKLKNEMKYEKKNLRIDMFLDQIFKLCKTTGPFITMPAEGNSSGTEPGIVSSYVTHVSDLSLSIWYSRNHLDVKDFSLEFQDSVLLVFHTKIYKSSWYFLCVGGRGDQDICLDRVHMHTTQALS